MPTTTCQHLLESAIGGLHRQGPLEEPGQCGPRVGLLSRRFGQRDHLVHPRLEQRADQFASFGKAPVDVPDAEAAVNTFQQVGGSIGTAVLSAFAATAASDFMVGRAPSPENQALATMSSYTTVFWWGAGIFATGAVICGLLFRSGPVAVDPDAEPVLAH